MQKYGLIGYPLGHSFSRHFFNEKFAAENLDAQYLNFEIPEISEFVHVVQDNPELNGLNVTIPYKQQIIPYLDGLNADAEAIGAVNVIKFEHSTDGTTRLVGYNSDIIGFKNSIQPLLKPSHCKALILGTGGASKAVFHGLQQLGIEPTYVSRTPKTGCLTYDDLTPALMKEYTVVVNTTPLGMYPKVEAAAPIPYSELTSAHLLYDLVYNPEETLFMKRGKEQGATVKNGLEMLHGQAIAAWKIWQKE